MIGPAEIEDILADYADALEAAGAAPQATPLVWPLCATSRAGDQPRAGVLQDPPGSHPSDDLNRSSRT